MADDEFWGLSAEQLDRLEKDAIRKISERKASDTQNRRLPESLRRGTSTSSSSRHGGKVDALFPTSSKVQSPDASKGSDSSQEKNSTTDLPKITVKLYLHERGAIAAKSTYSPLLVDAFHKIPNASWHGKERLWMFPASSLVEAEAVICGLRSANIEVQSLDPLVRRALTTSSTLPDLRELYDKMPSYIELKLLPFQREGVSFVLQHGGRALLADEMGLGKTLQALAVTACISDFWPVLVLCPSSLRLHWASMIQQWLSIPASDILVVLSQYGGSHRGGFNVVYLNKTKGMAHLDGLFNVVSYDAVPKLQDILLASKFKIVIADESHFLKNAQAKRTTASLPILQQAQFAFLLSGTPALSRPIELYKQLEALYPDVYRNVHEYGNRYCKGGIFGLYQGASNREELHYLMKETVMIRRLKKDVLSELPMKRRQQVFLDLNEKEMRQIRALFHELEDTKIRMENCESNEELESLKFAQKNVINKIYIDSAQAKIPAVLDYLDTVIEADCKFLIFSHHQSMMDAVHQYLVKKKVGCIRIDGSTPSTTRQSLVNDFQENDLVKAAVLSIRAGGVGLTLTAASTVIFAELSWTPGDIIQAEDRAHRIGQVSAVNIYYLLANGTVDDIMWDSVQNKLENLGQVLDGSQNTMEVSKSTQVSIPTTDSSPGKQHTLDNFFLKRCRNDDDHHDQVQKPKN